MSSLTRAPARQVPRLLNSSTTSPSEIPRAAASNGLIKTGSRPATFLREAQRAVVELRVQPRAGLPGNQRQRVLVLCVLTLIARRRPSGMTATFRQIKARNHLREYFNPARWCWARVLDWISSKIGQKYAIRRRGRAVQSGRRFESCPNPAGFARASRPHCAFFSQILRSHSSLVKPALNAPPSSRRFCQIAVNVKLFTGLPWRLGDFVHWNQCVIGFSCTEVVTFRRGRNWQNNICMARGSSPIDLIHDDGFGGLKCVMQPIEVLMMMERIATRPP